MSDDDVRGTPGGHPAGGPHEDVGSVGEEAAKLFGALADWARDHAGDLPGPAGPGAPSGAPGASGSEHGRADAAPGATHTHDPGVDRGAAAECHWCPVCRTVHLVRQTSPEVRAHLAQAATSLVQAAAGFLATTQTPGGARGARVEKIDLDDDSDWDEDHD